MNPSSQQRSPPNRATKYGGSIRPAPPWTSRWINRWMASSPVRRDSYPKAGVICSEGQSPISSLLRSCTVMTTSVSAFQLQGRTPTLCNGIGQQRATRRGKLALSRSSSWGVLNPVLGIPPTHRVPTDSRCEIYRLAHDGQRTRRLPSVLFLISPSY
jgi:hypothetical protein